MSMTTLFEGKVTLSDFPDTPQLEAGNVWVFTRSA